MTVAVPTYRRNDHLRELLPMLIAQIDTVPDGAVLIVDNDPDGGARVVVESVDDERVRYAHEPRPGLAAVRNRILDEIPGGLIACLDDDGRPEPDWLVLLVRTHQQSGATLVAGRVLERYEAPPEAWIIAGGFFRRRSLATGTRVPSAPAGNLLIDRQQVASLGLRFDERFGLTGGEDTLFTSQATALGGTIVWCEEARVTDLVPADRCTRRWVLARARSHGNTAVVVALALAGSPGARLGVRTTGLVGGLARVIVGAARRGWGKARGSVEADARGARLMHRGLGMMTAAGGRAVHAYAR